MNYIATKEDKKLSFLIQKSIEKPNCISGHFTYTSNKGQYISCTFSDIDAWTVMKKMSFTASQEIFKCYGENIEELANTCWNKFFRNYPLKTITLLRV